MLELIQDSFIAQLGLTMLASLVGLPILARGPLAWSKQNPVLIMSMAGTGLLLALEASERFSEEPSTLIVVLGVGGVLMGAFAFVLFHLWLGNYVVLRVLDERMVSGALALLVAGAVVYSSAEGRSLAAAVVVALALAGGLHRAVLLAMFSRMRPEQREIAVFRMDELFRDISKQSDGAK
jgi:hypothetical protein